MFKDQWHREAWASCLATACHSCGEMGTSKGEFLLELAAFAKEFGLEFIVSIEFEPSEPEGGANI